MGATGNITNRPAVHASTLTITTEKGREQVPTAGEFNRHVGQLSTEKMKASALETLRKNWLAVLKFIQEYGIDTSGAQSSLLNSMARDVIKRLDQQPLVYPDGTTDFLGTKLVESLGLDLDTIEFDDQFKSTLEDGLEKLSPEFVDKYYHALEPKILKFIASLETLTVQHSDIQKYLDSQARSKFIRYCVDIVAFLANRDGRETVDLDV
ncbi:MAG: hypothetical protein ABWZ27_11120, partial [Aestuariivirgaceae bacterium]